MKTQMLIIKGPGNAGKSTAVKLAFEMFLQSVVKKGTVSTVHYLYLTKSEVAVVIKIGDESIGIASRGDAEKHVLVGLTFFASHRCKVVICATRLRGKPLQAAQNFASTQLKVIPTELSKPIEKGATAQQVANLKTAKQLVRWLKSACR